MGELAQAMAMLSRGRLATCIQQVRDKQARAYGKFYLVGSIPWECTKPAERALTPGARTSIIYDTLEEAQAALKAAGVEQYQMPDCSWFGR